jgi:hypothetical protein
MKMENERLQHRVRELRVQKAPFMQTPSSPVIPTLTTSTLPSNFGGHAPSTASPQLSVTRVPQTVLDHSELATQGNPNPVTRNLDTAGLQEGHQDEPAKKKVRRIW